MSERTKSTGGMASAMMDKDDILGGLADVINAKGKAQKTSAVYDLKVKVDYASPEDEKRVEELRQLSKNKETKAQVAAYTTKEDAVQNLNRIIDALDKKYDKNYNKMGKKESREFVNALQTYLASGGNLEKNVRKKDIEAVRAVATDKADISVQSFNDSLKELTETFKKIKSLTAGLTESGLEKLAKGEVLKGYKNPNYKGTSGVGSGGTDKGTGEGKGEGNGFGNGTGTGNGNADFDGDALTNAVNDMAVKVESNTEAVSKNTGAVEELTSAFKNGDIGNSKSDTKGQNRNDNKWLTNLKNYKDDDYKYADSTSLQRHISKWTDKKNPNSLYGLKDSIGDIKSADVNQLTNFVRGMEEYRGVLYALGQDIREIDPELKEFIRQIYADPRVNKENILFESMNGLPSVLDKTRTALDAAQEEIKEYQKIVSGGENGKLAPKNGGNSAKALYDEYAKLVKINLELSKTGGIKAEKDADAANQHRAYQKLKDDLLELNPLLKEYEDHMAKEGDVNGTALSKAAFMQEVVDKFNTSDVGQKLSEGIVEANAKVVEAVDGVDKLVVKYKTLVDVNSKIKELQKSSSFEDLAKVEGWKKVKEQILENNHALQKYADEVRIVNEETNEFTYAQMGKDKDPWKNLKKEFEDYFEAERKAQEEAAKQKEAVASLASEIVEMDKAVDKADENAKESAQAFVETEEKKREAATKTEETLAEVAQEEQKVAEAASEQAGQAERTAQALNEQAEAQAKLNNEQRESEMHSPTEKLDEDAKQASADLSEVETVLSRIDELLRSISDQKFLDGVRASGIENLDIVLNRLKTLQEEIERTDGSQLFGNIGEVDSQKLQAMLAEAASNIKDKASRIADKEALGLGKLYDALTDVIAAIMLKNSAFEEEAKVVKNSVNAEKGDLSGLANTVKGINKYIEESLRKIGKEAADAATKVKNTTTNAVNNAAKKTMSARRRTELTNKRDGVSTKQDNALYLAQRLAASDARRLDSLQNGSKFTPNKEYVTWEQKLNELLQDERVRTKELNKVLNERNKTLDKYNGILKENSKREQEQRKANQAQSAKIRRQLGTAASAAKVSGGSTVPEGVDTSRTMSNNERRRRGMAARRGGNSDAYALQEALKATEGEAAKLNEETQQWKFNLQECNGNAREIGQTMRSFANDAEKATEATKQQSQATDNATRSEKELQALEKRRATIMTKMAKLNANISKTYERNSAYGNTARSALRGYMEELERGGKLGSKLADLDELENVDARLKQIAEDFNRIQAEEAAAGRSGRSFFGNMANQLTHLNAQFIAMYFSWMDWVRYARQGLETIKELDSALAEMNKVSDETMTRLKDFQKESYDLADAIGSTGLELQESTASFMRLGKSLEVGSQFAEAANILKNVSEFDSIDQASESLISITEAYKDMPVMDIIDEINNIGNNYQISTSEISEGLQNVAGVLSVNKNSIEEAIALITAGNAIDQDVSKASRGVRMIALRITGTEEAKQELADRPKRVRMYGDIHYRIWLKSVKLLKRTIPRVRLLYFDRIP